MLEFIDEIEKPNIAEREREREPGERMRSMVTVVAAAKKMRRASA